MNQEIETNKAMTGHIVTEMIAAGLVQRFELTDLITDVFNTVERLGCKVAIDVQIVDIPQAPAVSAKASVKPEVVTCMECGFKGKMLKRHLHALHQLSPEQYRARWGLPADHPLVAPSYSKRRRELAIDAGLGTKS